jgi:hypothetical protein
LLEFVPTGIPDATMQHCRWAVGQQWSAAIASVEPAGYPLRDAGAVQTAPQMDGFYLDRPGNRGLVVDRWPGTESVSLLETIDDWTGPPAGAAVPVKEKSRARRVLPE